MEDYIQVPPNYYSDTFLNPTRRYLLELLKVDVKLVRATGAHLFDADGNDYLDFLAQYGALPIGHNNPEVWEALIECFDQQIPSMVQPLIAIKAEELATKLAAITPGDLTYSIFANSGAETVEAAIKLARSRTGRTGILATRNGFHGQTLGALSATGHPHYHKRFGVPLPGFLHIPFGDLEALDRTLTEKGADIAAFIVEPIQGEGGIFPAPEGYLAAAQALCRRYGVLFVVDEIQTGLGRTGTLFAVDHEKIVPDMLLLAKALGGGVIPIGVCIVRPHVWDHHFGSVHSSTFANNNIAASLALKVIEILARDNWSLVTDTAQKGEYLLQKLHMLQQHYPAIIKDVRGRGLMVGVEFHAFDGEDSYTMGYISRNERLVAACSGYLLNVHRIITAPTLNQSQVLRIEPPLIITQEEIDRAVAAIDTLAATLEYHDCYHFVRYLVGNQKKPEQIKDYRTPTPKHVVRAKPLTPPQESFAFLVHPIYEQDILSADPSFEQFTPEEFGRWQEWLRDSGTGPVYHVPEIRSPSGKTAQGWLIAIPMLPRQMLRCGSKQVMTLLYQAVDIAKELGAKILGLGGFTAVISKGGQQLTNRGLAITTGNTVTALLAVDGIKRAAEVQGIDLGNAHAAVVGATGSIGRLVSLLLAPLVGSLTLIGNPRSADSLLRCQTIAEEIYQEMGSFVHQEGKGELSSGLLLQQVRENLLATSGRSRTLIRAVPERRAGYVSISTHMHEALAHAEIVVMATSADTPILQPDHLLKEAIVCDIARPSSVYPEMEKERPDVYVFEGGLAQLPDEVSFGPQIQHFHEGITVGCLAETILLALEGDYTDHSIGSSLSLTEAAQLRSAMLKHGFSLAPMPESEPFSHWRS